MGLGKTIEMLSLCLSNPRPRERKVVPIPGSAGASTNATLIVVPPTLLGQWRDGMRLDAKILFFRKLYARV
jgi:SNF2 family DNA or RNA helicase